MYHSHDSDDSSDIDSESSGDDVDDPDDPNYEDESVAEDNETCGDNGAVESCSRDDSFHFDGIPSLFASTSGSAASGSSVSVSNDSPLPLVGKAKATASAMMYKPSTASKRRSAKHTIPSTIKVRTSDTQPGRRSASASVASPARFAGSTMRQGRRLGPSSVGKAFKRLRHQAKVGNAKAASLRKRKSLAQNTKSQGATRTGKTKNLDPIAEKMLTAGVSADERRVIKEFMGKKVLAPIVLWFEDYHDSLSSLKVPKDGKVPMLDPDRILKYGLKAIYLVSCCSEGNFYATTDSAQRVHGAVYCHQMADVIAMIQDVCNEDHQVVIIGANECYEDDVLLVMNGSAATSLDGWNDINFRSIHNSLHSGNRSTVGKHNNNVISYGYSVQSKGGIDADGLHPPAIKTNTKNNPIVGSQFTTLSKVMMDADPTEKFLRRSGVVYDSRKKYAERVLVQSGYVNPEGNVNMIEGLSQVGNFLSLKKIKQTKTIRPVGSHLDIYNSDMDGFSGFFGANKTAISNTGDIARLGLVGYNRASVDHVTLQKVARQTVLHQVGTVAERMNSPDRRFVFPYIPDMLNEHDAEGGLFAVPSHLNIAGYESLLHTGFMDVQASHGQSTVLAAELASAIPFMNGTDKAFDTYTHIASLPKLPSENLTKYYVDWNNAVTGSNFSTGHFQRHRPPCQKPVPLPFIIYNSLVLRRIIKEANDRGLEFAEAVKIVKKEVFGADSLVAGRILRALSITGNIISNRYAVGAEIAPALAKRVSSVTSVPHCLCKTLVSFLHSNISYTLAQHSMPLFSFVAVPRAMAAKR